MCRKLIDISDTELQVLITYYRDKEHNAETERERTAYEYKRRQLEAEWGMR